MARDADEERRRATKYGRRRRLLEARSSRHQSDAVVQDLLRQLASSGVPRAEVDRLRANLKVCTDDRRRSAAIWAIVDALEAQERR